MSDCKNIDGQCADSWCDCGYQRGLRCGVCYWALYDGDWCQNPKCAMYGKSVNKNRIYLTNREARILIKATK